MERADWTTPADIRARVLRRWDRGQILAGSLLGEPLFPLSIPLRGPPAKELAERFEEVRRWIRDLDAESRQRRGWGYEIQWDERDLRELGRNRIPKALSVPTHDDALQLIGKQRHARRFHELAATTLLAFPSLREWLAKRPLTVLEHADAWARILNVLAWFRDHPKSGLYLRQVDIPGVDTKFIEARRGLLGDLLERVLPCDAPRTDANSFEARYGLLEKPALVRFRILDPRHRLGPLSDITTPVAQFAALDLRVRHVFITENETNGLAFPELADSIVIFGLGYTIERVRDAAWLRDKDLHYWGDLDTHGFAILDRIRGVLPRTRSFLMDRATLVAHRHFWISEAKPYSEPALTRLAPDEWALFDDIASNRMGSHVRLEQERIAFGWFADALAAIVVA